MCLTLSISVSVPLTTRCVILGTSLCVSGFLFPICRMGLIRGLTSQDTGEGYPCADAWPQGPALAGFQHIACPLFPFLTPSLGWYGAGKDTGSGTRGLAKVTRLVMGPGWGGRARG